MSRVRLQRSEAIVLNRRDYGEADRILTLYTLDRGKVGAIAKGARRIASRMAGHIELFTHGEYMLAKGHNLDIVTQASGLRSIRALREDLLRATYAYHVAEMVDRFCEPGAASAPVFELLRETLEALGDAEDPALVTRWFELHLLSALGYQPQLFNCAICDAELGADGNAFSPEAGGVLCQRCRVGVADAMPLADGTFRVMRFLQSRDLRTAVKIALHDDTRADLERIAHATVRHILERDLKSVDFLDRLRRVAAAGKQSTTPNAPPGDDHV